MVREDDDDEDHGGTLPTLGQEMPSSLSNLSTESLALNDSVTHIVAQGAQPRLVNNDVSVTQPNKKIKIAKADYGEETGNSEPSLECTYGGFRDPDFFDTMVLDRQGEEFTGFTPEDNNNNDIKKKQKAMQIRSSTGGEGHMRSNMEIKESDHMSGTSTSKSHEIILIEPIPDHREAKAFFANDIKMARLFHASDFCQSGIIDISKNLRKNLVILKLRPTNQVKLNELLKISSIGDWKVKCKTPNSQQVSYGVIGPIGADTPENEITEELKVNGYNVKETKRLTKGKEKTPTLSVRITFNDPELPETVFCSYQRFKVRVFVDRPWQCFKCQGFGHNAVDCRGKSRCAACAGSHETRDCPNRGSNQQQVRCANCKGNHTASYGGCEFIKRAKEIEKIRAETRMSYRDAVTSVKNNVNQKFHNPTILTDNIPSTNQDHSTVTHPSIRPKIRPQYKQVSDASTQTFQEQKQVQTQMVYCDQKFGAQLAILLVKVVQMKKNDSLENQLTTITKLMKNIMGINIDEKEIMYQMDESDNNPIKNKQEQEKDKGKTNKRKNSLIAGTSGYQGDQNSTQNHPTPTFDSHSTQSRVNPDKVSVVKYSNRGKPQGRGKQLK